MADKQQETTPDAAVDGPASGSVERPVAPDEAQPGDRSEMGANLGGPVDVFPDAPGRGARRGGVERPVPAAAAVPPERTDAEKRRD